MHVQAVQTDYQPEPMAASLPGGRLYELSFRPLLGECAPSGRARLDAIARWLQDVAYSDVEDAGVAQLTHWVLRRNRIHVLRFPCFGEVCRVSTFCSAVGPMWAQRRTTVTLADDPTHEPLVEAVALWVHLDPSEHLPTHVTDAEIAVYGASIGDRRVAARLRHPRPTQAQLDDADVYDWTFHRADVDMAEHVNNTVYWDVLEDALIEREQAAASEHHEEPTPRIDTLDVELEFRLPVHPGALNVVTSGAYRWLTDPTGEELYASIVLLHLSGI